MGFLYSRYEHLHLRFIGMNNLLAEYLVAQCINQWLQLNPGYAHSLSQG